MNEYVVRQGDTLSGISKRLGVPLLRLIQINQIQNPNAIRSGQVLKLPSTGSQYTVSKGETLSSIAKDVFGDASSWRRIAQANPGMDPNRISPGQVVKIPGETRRVDPSTFAGPPYMPPGGPDPASMYTVKQGDTLSDIAKMVYGRADMWRAISAANPGVNPHQIGVGQTLVLPEDNQARPDPSFESWEDIAIRMREQNKASDHDIIRSYHQGAFLERGDMTPFAVVDKQAGKMFLYEASGKLLSSYNVGTGTKVGDQRTVHNYPYKTPEGDPIKTPEGDPLVYDNEQTQAGIWTTRQTDIGPVYQSLYGGRILELEDDRGTQQATAIHAVPMWATSRTAALRNNDPSDNRLSWGCVNCLPADFDRVRDVLGVGAKVYILPEEPGNRFMIRDGRLKFFAEEGKNPFPDPEPGAPTVGGYVYSPKRPSEVAPTKMSTRAVEYGAGRYATSPGARRAAEALEKAKPWLMRDLGIGNDEYNELARITFGVLGQESKWGNAIASPMYMAEQTAFSIYDALSSFGVDVPKIGRASRGAGQMRRHLMPEVAREYGITWEDLDDPAAATIATFAQMVANYRRVKNIANTDSEAAVNIAGRYLEFTPMLYRGEIDFKTAQPDMYVKNVFKYGQGLEIQQKGQYLHPEQLLPEVLLEKDVWLNDVLQGMEPEHQAVPTTPQWLQSDTYRW